VRPRRACELALPRPAQVRELDEVAEVLRQVRLDGRERVGGEVAATRAVLREHEIGEVQVAWVELQLGETVAAAQDAKAAVRRGRGGAAVAPLLDEPAEVRA
jgi:hypothetical protein